MRLLREMGAVEGVDARGAPTFAEELLIREPEERLFYKGEWYEGLYLRAEGEPSRTGGEPRRPRCTSRTRIWSAWPSSRRTTGSA
jgi:hypothetical protein